MSDIQITLQLERRSGILAGAVASLHRNGLQFRSQHLRDSGADGSLLVLEAEGELTETESLIDALRGMRGVTGVTELAVDGEIVFDSGQAATVETPRPELSPQLADNATAFQPPANDSVESAPAVDSAKASEAGERVTVVDLSDDDDELFPPPDPDPPASEPVREAAADIPGAGPPTSEPVRESETNTANALPAAAARRRRYNR